MLYFMYYVMDILYCIGQVSNSGSFGKFGKPVQKINNSETLHLQQTSNLVPGIIANTKLINKVMKERILVKIIA